MPYSVFEQVEIKHTDAAKPKQGRSTKVKKCEGHKRRMRDRIYRRV